MKLKPLQKDKHYDLRGVCEKGLKLIEEFCQRDNHTPRLEEIGELSESFFVLTYNSEYYSSKDRWHIAKVEDEELEKPVFVDAEGAVLHSRKNLQEYAKELFALCLAKNLTFGIMGGSFEVRVGNTLYYSSFSEHPDTTPIWELIEKVKSL